MAGGAARDRLPEGRTMFAFFMADRSFFFFLAASGLGCSTWGFFVACASLVALRHPRPGIEPASSALEGEFLTTGPPPGKSPWLTNSCCLGQ